MPSVVSSNGAAASSSWLSPRELIYGTIRAVFFRRHHENPYDPATQLEKRQGGIPIPTLYITKGPAPGTVVGIVLGSIAGFLLVAWLIMSVTNPSNLGYGDEEVTIERRRSMSRAGGTVAPRSRRSRRSEIREVREVREISRSPIRRERETIVEERRRSVREPSPARSVILEDIERRVEGDDVVEVFEEHSSVSSPPPRRKSTRRSSGYRQVDPDLYAGGDFERERIRSSRR